MCVPNCPVSINIPKFIQHVKNREFEEAAKLLMKLVLYQLYVEEYVLKKLNVKVDVFLGIKGEPIAIGKLERFVGDWSRENDVDLSFKGEKKDKKLQW